MMYRRKTRFDRHQQRRCKSCVFSAELHSSLLVHVYLCFRKALRPTWHLLPSLLKFRYTNFSFHQSKNILLYITTIFTIMTSPFLPQKSFLYFFISRFFQTHKIMSSHLLQPGRDPSGRTGTPTQPQNLLPTPVLSARCAEAMMSQNLGSGQSKTGLT